MKKFKRIFDNILRDYIRFMFTSLWAVALFYFIDWKMGAQSDALLHVNSAHPLILLYNGVAIMDISVYKAILQTVKYTPWIFLSCGMFFSYLDNFSLPIAVLLCAFHVQDFWSGRSRYMYGTVNQRQLARAFSTELCYRYAVVALLFSIGMILMRQRNLRRPSKAAAWAEAFFRTISRGMRYVLLPAFPALYMALYRVELRFYGYDFWKSGYLIKIFGRTSTIPLADFYRVVYGIIFLGLLLHSLSNTYANECANRLLRIQAEETPNVINLRVREWQYPFRRVAGAKASSNHPLVKKRRQMSPYDPYTYANIGQKQDLIILITWNSREDWNLPRRHRRPLIRWLQNAERRGRQIIVRDTYLGSGSYATRGELGEMLSRYPYYRMGAADSVDKLLLDEAMSPTRKDNQTLRQRLNACMTAARGCKDPVLTELVRPLAGASTELTRYFYILMKVCEYLIQTEALASLCREEGPVFDPEHRLDRPSMGDFTERLPDSRERVEDREVLDCLRALNLAATRSLENRNRLRKVSYKELCRVLCQVRRRFVGHGTLVYAVSIPMVSNLARVTQAMLERRRELDTALPKDGAFILGERSIPAAARRWRRRLYYNGTVDGEYCRYLDYVTGRVLICDAQGRISARKLPLSTFREWEERPE